VCQPSGLSSSETQAEQQISLRARVEKLDAGSGKQQMLAEEMEG
jgi:hypothetical protein